VWRRQHDEDRVAEALPKENSLEDESS
jgi:hypothetical protein